MLPLINEQGRPIWTTHKTEGPTHPLKDEFRASSKKGLEQPLPRAHRTRARVKQTGSRPDLGKTFARLNLIALSQLCFRHGLSWVREGRFTKNPN